MFSRNRGVDHAHADLPGCCACKVTHANSMANRRQDTLLSTSTRNEYASLKMQPWAACLFTHHCLSLTPLAQTSGMTQWTCHQMCLDHHTVCCVESQVLLRSRQATRSGSTAIRGSTVLHQQQLQFAPLPHQSSPHPQDRASLRSPQDQFALDESHLKRLKAQAAAVSIHELAERRALLDLELHLAALLVLHLQLNVRWCVASCCTISASNLLHHRINQVLNISAIEGVKTASTTCTTPLVA